MKDGGSQLYLIIFFGTLTECSLRFVWLYMMDRIRPPPLRRYYALYYTSNPLLDGPERHLPEQSSARQNLPSLKTLKYNFNKELPSIPEPIPDTSSTSLPPEVPPYNPLRFSRISSNESLAENTVIPMSCHSIYSEVPSSLQPLTPQTPDANAPKTFRLLGHLTLTPKTPTYGRTNKVHQLTGYDLASPTGHRHHRKSYHESVSSASSYYSDDELYYYSGREDGGSPGKYLSQPASTRRRISKKQDNIAFDDLVQRECARLEHDTSSPATSAVHSPIYSKLPSEPPTSPASNRPHPDEVDLPFRTSHATSNRSASRFSDSSTRSPSTHNISSTARFVTSIRDSVLLLKSHESLRRSRPMSQIWVRRKVEGATEAERALVRAEESYRSCEEVLSTPERFNKPSARKSGATPREELKRDGKRTNGGLMRRLSNALSSKRPARPIQSVGPRGDGMPDNEMGIVIPDHQRRIDGPDTPMPDIRHVKGWDENALPVHASKGRRESVREAISKMSYSRWSANRKERKKKEFKRQIRIVGLAQSPFDTRIFGTGDG